MPRLIREAEKGGAERQLQHTFRTLTPLAVEFPDMMSEQIDNLPTDVSHVE